MAFYRLNLKIIKRSNGYSAIAAAAYRHGTCIYDKYVGQMRDYRKKQWIVRSRVLIPKQAPNYYKDTAVLWNEVESIEKNSRAQLARDFVLSLPIELSLEDQIAVTEAFITENFTSQGMCADYSIHNPPVTNSHGCPVDHEGNPTKHIEQMTFQNPHVHIMTPMRALDENGKWIPKNEAVYLCKQNGEEQEIPASQWPAAKEAGWCKQYSYMDGKKKVWLVPEEADKKNLTRLSKTPKSVKGGRIHPLYQSWCDRDRMRQWRTSWQDILNEKFRERNMSCRVDARSLKEQGRTLEIPLVHVGKAAHRMDLFAMEQLKKGVPLKEVSFSEAFKINVLIKRYNQLVRGVQEELKQLADQAQTLIQKIAHGLEESRLALLVNRYQQFFLSQKRDESVSRLSALQMQTTACETLAWNTKKADENADNRIRQMQGQLNKLSPLKKRERQQLLEAIEKERKEQAIRAQHLHQQLSQNGYESIDALKNASDEKKRLESGIDSYNTALNELNLQYETNEKNYAKTIADIPKAYQEEINNERMKLRDRYNALLADSLQIQFRQEFRFPLLKKIMEGFDHSEPHTRTDKKEKIKIH